MPEERCNTTTPGILSGEKPSPFHLFSDEIPGNGSIPGQFQLPLILRTISQIQIDQCLVRDSGGSCLLLEIINGFHIQIDGDLPLRLLRIRIRPCIGEIVFFLQNQITSQSQYNYHIIIRQASFPQKSPDIHLFLPVILQNKKAPEPFDCKGFRHIPPQKRPVIHLLSGSTSAVPVQMPAAPGDCHALFTRPMGREIAQELLRRADLVQVSLFRMMGLHVDHIPGQIPAD